MLHWGIKCKNCNTEIYSFNTHDFKRCQCGACFIDGGFNYKRIGYHDKEDIQDISLDLSNGWDMYYSEKYERIFLFNKKLEIMWYDDLYMAKGKLKLLKNIYPLTLIAKDLEF